MRATVSNTLLIILALNTGWFVAYSAGLGLDALTSETPGEVSRVFLAGSAAAHLALAAHMIAGAIVTIGAPLQALPLLRRHWPDLHRRAGYVLFALAWITGVGGLVYIALAGTVGGVWMSFWFAVYGAALLWSASATIYFALDKDLARHFAWATRFVILAVGSWIYRMHYALWFTATGGVQSNDAFTGLFDQIQVVAFFVPYLLVAEIFLRRAKPTRR